MSKCSDLHERAQVLWLPSTGVWCWRLVAEMRDSGRLILPSAGCDHTTLRKYFFLAGPHWPVTTLARVHKVTSGDVIYLVKWVWKSFPVFISFYIKVQSTNHSELQWSARLWGLRCYRGELWYWTNYNIQNMIRRSTPSYSHLKISYLVIKEYNKLVIYMLYSFYWMVTL